MKIVISRTGNDLLREKQKDYRNVVIVQVLIITLGLVLSGVLLDSGGNSSRLAISIFFGLGILYNLLLWDMLRNFTANRLLLQVILFVLIAIPVSGMLFEFPYYKIIELENRERYLFIVHATLFPIEVIIIAYTIRDIFTGQFLTPDKLWGSACIFLMTGISFGSLYDLICISIPGSLKPGVEAGFPNYAECVTYSFRMLTGMDSDYPSATKLIRNISVLESIWGNLFTVLIIGKLLGLPRLENSL